MPIIAAVIGFIVAIVPYFSRIIQLFSTFHFVKNILSKKNLNNNQTNKSLSKKQAREILEVSEKATKKEILDSYKNLMKKNHPDAGGSKYLASQLNQAKDILLKKK